MLSIQNFMCLMSCSFLAIAGPVPRNMDSSPLLQASTAPGSTLSQVTSSTVEIPQYTTASITESAGKMQPTTTSFSLPIPQGATMGIPDWFSSVQASLNHETWTGAPPSSQTSYSFAYSPPSRTVTQHASEMSSANSATTVYDESTTTLFVYKTIHPTETPTSKAATPKTTSLTDNISCSDELSSTISYPMILTMLASSQVQKVATSAAISTTDSFGPSQTAEPTPHYTHQQTSSSPPTAHSSPTNSPDKPGAAAISHSASIPSKIPTTFLTKTSETASHSIRSSSTSDQPAGITIVPINPSLITVTVTATDPGVTKTVTFT